MTEGRSASCGSGPRPVSPTFRRLRAFVTLLRGWWHPCPSGGMKRGVGPFAARCGGAAVLPRQTPPQGPRQTRLQGQPRGPDQGNPEGSIFVLDKAVISPPHTPSRNAGRGYGFVGTLAALGHPSDTSRCHHFLSRAIKPAMSGAKSAAVATFPPHEKCHQTHFKTIFGGFNDRRKSKISDADRS